MTELLRKAAALWQHAQAEGKTITRDEMAQVLNISDRRAGEILFALKNRNLLNYEPKHIEVEAGAVEIAIGDIHIPYQDDMAVAACLDYADSVKPSIISVMGDMLDCYNISTFDKNPLRSKRLFEEINQGKAFLTMLRERYPQARIIFYEGNHEERISRYILRNASQLAELLETLLVDKLGLNELEIEYHNTPFQIGNLWHMHGHEKPSGQGNPEYITNVMMQFVYDHFICFHFHRSQTKLYRRIGDRFWKACAVGYLAGQMDYMKLNKWQQGFAVIHYRADGEFSVDNKTIINGQVY